ncbi:MAG TPA: SoxR reducing system RseC family protein [Xanthomonadales bacterium]|nr:SoxR reducing system RseC family protein [Xanthomonadales bacterium]
MIEQQGRVVAAVSERAVVRLGGTAGCPACDAGRGCGAGIFGRLLRRRPVDLTFDNHLQACAGQAVVVGLPEAWFLRLVTRFYLLPLLAGLVAAAFGHYLFSMFGAGTAVTDLATLVAAVLAGWWVVRRNRLWSAQYPDAMEVHLLRVADNDESIKE